MIFGGRPKIHFECFLLRRQIICLIPNTTTLCRIFFGYPFLYFYALLLARTLFNPPPPYMV